MALILIFIVLTFLRSAFSEYIGASAMKMKNFVFYFALLSVCTIFVS